MEEKQKVYIKGVPGRGKEVIKALTDLGGRNTLGLEGEREQAVYFIDHKGKINNVGLYSEMAKLFVKNYREIKLPEKMKGLLNGKSE